MAEFADITAAINRARGSQLSLRASRPLGGGSINRAWSITLSDGSGFFVKTAGTEVPDDTFRIEFESLQLLAGPGVIDVPAPVAYGADFLVLEWVVSGTKADDWQEDMGRSLARLHRATQTRRFGFPHDTYLGTTRQDNRWCDNWLDFFREQRLAAQLRLFAEQAPADDPVLRKGEALLPRLEELIGGSGEPAVLLHGDLWAGNAGSNACGKPVVYDPACYYGEREAEFGMMRLFGGFDARCEAAYGEIWPFREGAETRFRLYRLYHELNHLNLFGAAYYSACEATLDTLL